ncbi:MAG: hypothetical protein ACLPV8_07345 [Steroidobacteraceae bacterium]
MSIKFAPWRVSVIGLAALGIVAGCLVGPGGYDGTVGVGYVGGYYAPGGYDYGGWGHGYRVAPPRGGFAPAGHGGRAAPSIPSRSRGR